MLSLAFDGVDAVNAKLQAMPTGVQAALKRSVGELVLKLRSHVQQDKLSGQVLNVRSGKLRDAIQQNLTEEGGGVVGSVSVAGGVPYAAIQEFGSQIPAHDITPRNAAALAFTIDGRKVFAKIVHNPGATLPARPYLRSALDDMRDEVLRSMGEAAQAGAKQAFAQ